MRSEAFASAKVNLYLHVGPRRGDGFHPISSLMVFADVGDRLVLAPAQDFDLVVEGPFAADLSAGPDNLVARARDAVLALGRRPRRPFRLILDKRLPVASGLGGGSADAAATLRIVAAALAEPAAMADLERIARALGADVPACLAGASVIAGGRGEILAPAPQLPALPAVLVNPAVPAPTAEVYGLFDAEGAKAPLDVPPTAPVLPTAPAVAKWLSRLRNDLEGPAIRRAPALGAALAALRARPETLLARTSGSGASCFALCATSAAAARLAAALAAAHPAWWVRACRLCDAATARVRPGPPRRAD